MRQAILLGNPESKRSIYLKKAMEEAGLSLLVLDVQKIEKKLLAEFLAKEIFLKIDPPVWKSSSILELPELMEGYKGELMALAALDGKNPITFFNHPSAITALLDKRSCKEVLVREGISVTESLGGDNKESHICNLEMLLEQMRQEKLCQIFIKPVNGSGALGVSAFRMQKRTGKMQLYTCAALTESKTLVNTKQLMCLSDRAQIENVLDILLKMDTLIERWHPKPIYQGYSYDLRAVVQDGRIDMLLARLSKGPITNLQLNNRPLAIEELGLPKRVLEEISYLCQRAMGCFSGLRSAGIDLLLDRGSLTPRVIEMNAQGDLIYQDIYQENKIYRHQAEIIKGWLYNRREDR